MLFFFFLNLNSTNISEHVGIVSYGLGPIQPEIFPTKSESTVIANYEQLS